MRVVWECLSHGVNATSEPGQEIRFSCGCVIPVHEGVQDFVQADSYADAFGIQWREWSRTQLDSHTRTQVSKRRLLDALGTELSSNLGKRSVLEAGCGAGRFTEILLERGADVLSVDLSEAAFVNAKNCPPGDKHVIARADATRLPLMGQQFDLVLALGMVQHTRSSKETLIALWDMVKPGGYLVVDHYASGLRYFLQVKPLYRQFLKRQPPDRAMKLCNALYDLWAPLHRHFTSRFGRRMLARVSPIVYFTDELPELSEGDKDAWGRLDTFDSLTDWYKHRISRASLVKLLEALEPAQLEAWEGANGWIARASRPTLA